MTSGRDRYSIGRGRHAGRVLTGLRALMCVGLVVLAVPARAQGERQWQVAVSAAAPDAGPASDFEASMRASGFNEPSGGCVFFGLCAPSGETPRSYTGFGQLGFPFVVQVDHRGPGRRTGVSVLYANTPIGETHGIHAPFTNLWIEYATDTVAGLAVLGSGVFSVGAGLALHVARARAKDLGDQGLSPWESHVRIGAVGQVRMTVPARSFLFFDANGQYRYVGGVEVGPMTPYAVLQPGATFPKSRASFSHWALALGIGARF